MKTIAFAQQKGGVGKSSAAINLACVAVAAGRNVVLVDCDIEQATAMKWYGRREGKALPIVILPKSGRLEEELAKIDGKTDLVILDLPGRSSPLVSAGMKAAHIILVPCRPIDMDIEASLTTVEAAMRAQKRYAYLMNIVPPQLARAKTYAEHLRKAGHPVAPTIIVQRMQVPDAIAEGSSAQESEPKGQSAAEFRDLLAWLTKELKSK